MIAERTNDVPDDVKRWLEDLRVDWRELRSEVMKVLQWQAETRPICESHSKKLEDHEQRIRDMETSRRDIEALVQSNTALVQEYKSSVQTGLTVGTKVAIFLAWLASTGIAWLRYSTNR